MRTQRTPKKSLFEKYSKAWGYKPKDPAALELAALKMSSLVLKATLLPFRRMQRVSQRPFNDYNQLSQLHCSSCGNKGLQRLTQSSKENLTPRFLKNITQLFPSLNESIDLVVRKADPWHSRKMSDLADISAIQIENSGFIIDTPELTSRTPQLSERSNVLQENVNRDLSTKRSVGLRVPKLNIHQFKAKPAPPQLNIKVKRGFDRLKSLQVARLQMGFDRLLLAAESSSRLSLTFELSQEDSIILDGARFTGRFRTSRAEVAQPTYLTAAKIMLSRFDKLIYRRLLLGFFKLQETQSRRVY